jgi:DNA adenine methylase
MKPLIKYRGGKSKEIPQLIKHIPKYSGRYIEPFFGGGALYFYLEPKKAIINDINSKLMAFYLGVRDILKY